MTPWKVLVTPLGSSGDVHPFVGVAGEMRRRGHDVTVITNGYFKNIVERSGLRFLELGTAEEYVETIRDPLIFDKRKGFKAVAQKALLPGMPLLYEVLRQEFEPGRTVLVSQTTAFAARMFRELHDFPLVTLHLQPMVFRSVHEVSAFPGLTMQDWWPKWMKRGTYRLMDFVVARVLDGPINAFRAEIGLPPLKRVFDQWIHSPDGTLGLFPDWYGGRQPDWPAHWHTTGFPLFDESGQTPMPEGVEEFLASGSAPIAFTPGSAMRNGADFFRESALACQRAGRRGVLLTRFDEQIPRELPPGVRHFSYVPFGALLPRCAAIVHHGGIGTSAQGLAAGVPQLIMPMSHDQPDNARRLERLGVGASLTPAKFTASRIASTLDKLLSDPTIGVRAKQLAKSISPQKSRVEIGDRIEQIAKAKFASGLGAPGAKP